MESLSICLLTCLRGMSCKWYVCKSVRGAGTGPPSTSILAGLIEESPLCEPGGG